MKKAWSFNNLSILFKYLLSFPLLVFTTILKELSIVLPHEDFDYKNKDNKRLCRFKSYAVVSIILTAVFLSCSFNTISKHSLITLDILFFFYILIPFLYKTYSKYLPFVN
ncbi:MAG: hypothetical protein K0R50_577 [Eubacterium sp.]|jgi:hypothetical protein|nr:hypothetical protein [Eubacterium sp.]